MKISCPIKQITVTQSNLAKTIGISTARICKLAKEGTIVRDDDDPSGGVFLYDSLVNYWLRTGLSDVTSDEEDIDYMSERAKHERVKRQFAELKLAKAEARLYDARTVELVLTEMLSNLRTQLLGLPSKLAPALEGKNKNEIYEYMTREIEDKLSELSEYAPEMFTKEEIGVTDDEESD